MGERAAGVGSDEGVVEEGGRGRGREMKILVDEEAGVEKEGGVGVGEGEEVDELAESEGLADEAGDSEAGQNGVEGLGSFACVEMDMEKGRRRRKRKGGLWHWWH